MMNKDLGIDAHEVIRKRKYRAATRANQAPISCSGREADEGALDVVVGKGGPPFEKTVSVDCLV